MSEPQNGNDNDKQVSFYTFITYYGLIYLIFMIIIAVGYPLAQTYAKPLASFIFPIAQDNSLLKNLLVSTGMYWGMVLFYVLGIQKIKLRF